MKVAHEHRLIFNGEKCAMKCNSVKFFGCVYGKDHVHPDPSKVSAMKEMPTPQSPTKLQILPGMVTYLAPFIPSLFTQTTPLWELFTKDVEYTWYAAYQEAFDKLKSLMCTDTTLDTLM